MITVCLNKAEFEYDIHSLVKAFYAGQEVKVSADLQKIHNLEQQSPPLFRIEVFYQTGENGKTDKIQFTLNCLEKETQENAEAVIERETETDFADRKETKNRLKRCLYKMLSDYTGKTLPWGTLTGIRPVKISMSMLEEGSESEVR